MTEQLPDPPKGGYKSIDDLAGQTVNIAEVFTMRDGTPLVLTTTGAAYLCDNEWASQGATVIQAQLNADNTDFVRVRVVEEDDFVGFRNVEES